MDEFIVPLGHINQLRNVLDHFWDTNIGSLLMIWKTFGTSYIWDILPGTLLTEQLLLRMEDKPNLTKAIFKPEATDKAHIHGVSKHSPGYEQKTLYDIRINHYQFRGRKNALLVRCNAKVNSEEEMTPQDLRKIEHFESIYNQCVDISITKYIPLLKKSMNFK
jgi:hypothetical protein